MYKLSVSSCIQKLQLNRAGETRIERPNSLFHDLAVRSDRIGARLIDIFVGNVYIAHVHDLLRMNELSFQVSTTKRHHARSPYRRSNPNPLIGFPSLTLSSAQFESEGPVPASQQTHSTTLSVY